MKRTLLAFLAIAFGIYWLCTAKLPNDRPASLAPELPSVMHALPEPAAKRLGEFAGQGLMKLAGDTRVWLAREATKMKRPGNPSVAAIRLKRRALGLKPGDLGALRAIALDQSAESDQRILAVYMIGLSESAAAEAELRKIGKAPVPSTPNEKGYSDEITIRTQALESLLKRLNPDAAGRFLNEIITKSSDPALLRRARFWLSRQ